MEYNPDRIVQQYYKQINEVRLLLTALGNTVIDEDVKRNAYATFEKHINLKAACQDWNRSALTTWAKMKTHFSTEIQMNNTHSVIIQEKEQANAVLNHTKIPKKHETPNNKPWR